MSNGLIILLIIAWLFVSYFLAIHANDNGKSMLWGVLVFFTGIFGLAIYAISLASD